MNAIVEVIFSRREIDQLDERAGIYAIINGNNDMTYVGQTINFKN